MFRIAQDWMSWLSAYFKPQPTARITIRSARDWMNLPSVSVYFLEILRVLNKLSITVSLPPRIIKAWGCKEENDEDIIYIEAIMPLEYDMFPGIHASETNFFVGENYKLACFLVCFEDYKRLRVIQKDLLEPKLQGLDGINELLVRRIDHDHLDNFTSRMPQEKKDEIKQYYLENGLVIGFNDVSEEELFKLVRQRKERD